MVAVDSSCVHCERMWVCARGAEDSEDGGTSALICLAVCRPTGLSGLLRSDIGFRVWV